MSTDLAADVLDRKMDACIHLSNLLSHSVLTGAPGGCFYNIFPKAVHRRHARQTSPKNHGYMEHDLFVEENRVPFAAMPPTSMQGMFQTKQTMIDCKMTMSGMKILH